MANKKGTLASRLIADYKSELDWARQLKSKGIIEVPSDEAGEKLANGRSNVPIDEYITHWESGLAALKAGADPELYNY